MAGRSIQAAYKNFLDPLDRALECITPARITRLKPEEIPLDREFSVALAEGNPSPLKSPDNLFITVQQTAKIVRGPGGELGRFRAHTIKYSYAFAIDVCEEDPSGREILAFHWTPDTLVDDEKRFAHLHIKSPMLASPPPVVPKKFSSAHIPTERLCVESIVRFAIEELGVTALNPNWDRILTRGEAAWRKYRTRTA